MTRTRYAPPPLPVLLGALVLPVAGAVLFATTDVGRVSLQMVEHLLVMNVLAPLAAVLLTRSRSPLGDGTRALWPLASVQVALLWAWHAPALQRAATDAPLLHWGMTAALALAALAFWIAVLDAAGTARWSAVLALLLTGKLACLLGALMIFAPRDLYGLPGAVMALCTIGPSSLADQQLAGLLMITACPLSYVVAGTALAARALLDLDRASTASG